MADPNFTRRWFIGEGLDIGGKPDPLSLYVPFFPGLKSVRVWDWEDGDAQFLEGLAPESLDFVHSSHCLEHLVDPRQGLKAWFGALKPGGRLILEIGWRQADAVCALCLSAGYEDASVRSDLSGNPRCVLARRPIAF